MRADIHDGPEHMLQSETEYIDARPHQSASTKASCTARPDHTLGHKRKCSCLNGMSVLPPRADLVRPARHVRFVPRCDIDANDATATRTRTLIMAASWSGSAPAPQVRARYARRVGAKGPGVRQRRERWRAVGVPAFSSDPALERPR